MGANFGEFATKTQLVKLTLANLNVQSILAEETLANLWSFAKSANVSTLKSFPPYGNL